MILADFKAGSPEDLAKIFAVFTLPDWKKGKMVNFQNEIGSRWRGIFEKSEKLFRVLFSFRDKYGLDVQDYVFRFASSVYDRGKTPEENVSEMVSINSINWYLDLKQEEEQDRKIMGWYMKSVRNVAEDALASGYRSSKKYILNMVKKDRLGEDVMAGRVSIYYLAAISGFDRVLERVSGRMVGKTLEYLLYNFDVYSKRISDACLRTAGHEPSPFKETDEMVVKLLG